MTEEKEKEQITRPQKGFDTPKPMFDGWKDEDIIKFHENMIKTMPDEVNAEGIKEIIKKLKKK